MLFLHGCNSCERKADSNGIIPVHEITIRKCMLLVINYFCGMKNVVFNRVKHYCCAGDFCDGVFAQEMWSLILFSKVDFCFLCFLLFIET